MIMAATIVWLSAADVSAGSPRTPRTRTLGTTFRTPPPRPLPARDSLTEVGSAGAGTTPMVPANAVSLGTVGYSMAPPPEPPVSADGEAEAEITGPDEEEEAVATPSRLVRRRGVPPFWINYEYDTHTTTSIAFPPLFVHRKPKPGHPEKFAHADLSFTFGWHSRRGGKRRWLNPLALFYGSFSERKTVWGAVPLLMGYRRVGEKFNFGQFPLVWWWGTKYVKNFLFVPFHYQKKAPDQFRAVSALLFWYGNKNLDDANLDNDRRHFVGAPVFYRFQRGVKRFDFAFLYIGGENKLKGKKYLSFAPFAVWHRGEFGNKRDFWTLGWIQRSDRARGKSAWAVPLTLTFRHDDRDRRVFSATPLFWHTRNHLKGSRFTLAAGVVGHYDDPSQRNSFFAPLWFRFHDKSSRSSTNLFIPFAISRRSPDRTAVWTLLGGGRKTSDGWAFGLLPAITFFGGSKDGRRFGTVAGALWHVARPATADKPARSLWLAGPLGYADRRGDRRHFGLVPALTFVGWGGGKHYQVVTPLLWHVRDVNAGRRTLVAGPLFHHKTKEGFDGGVAPLVFWGGGAKQRYGVVPWLLVADVNRLDKQHRVTVSPILIRSKSPDHTVWGALGIVWDVRRAGNEHHTLAFPFVYRRYTPDRTVVVTPIGGQLRRDGVTTSVFGPFWLRKSPQRSGFGVLPLFGHDRHSVPGGTASNTALFPLFLHRRTPTDDLYIWSPFVWRSRVRGEKPRTGLAVVPFYFQQRQRGGVDVDAGLGFFWSRDPRRRTHTIIGGPFFHRLSRKSVNTGVFPTTWWMDSVEKRRLLSLPAIFHFEDKVKNSHTTVSIPFWFDRKRPDGRRAWAAFPFVFGGRRGYNHARFSLAPPGYFDIFRLHRNARFAGYVPLLFRYEKCGFQEGDDPRCRYRLWGSFPFFLAGKDGMGRRTHGALVYYWDRRPSGYRLYTPVFGITNTPGKILGVYAGPVGVRYTNTHLRSFVFPVWYRKKHRLEDTSLTLAVPPLFISRHRKDRRFFEAGLLVWQFRQQHKVSTAILPPVFYLSHSYAERKLYWVLPFFIRDNQMGKDKAFFTIPVLYTQYRNRENLDFVQFPLVWHIERGENQGTWGAMLWWDIRVKGKMFQTVPVLFTRWATPERDTKIIGPGLGWWTRGRGAFEGDRSWRMLFGLFGGGVQAGRKYAVVFGAKIQRGAAPAAKPKTARQLRREARRAMRAERRATRAMAKR
jgi:hypothetical protein